MRDKHTNLVPDGGQAAAAAEEDEWIKGVRGGRTVSGEVVDLH